MSRNKKVLVNGVETKFDSYNINGNNYFKLRDLAMALTGSEKQFDVTWNAASRMIGILERTPYTPVGGEMVPGDGSNQTAIPQDFEVMLFWKGGGIVPMPLSAYNIKGNNFVKLRDLGEMLNFGVAWNAEKRIVEIDTNTYYDAFA